MTAWSINPPVTSPGVLTSISCASGVSLNFFENSVGVKLVFTPFDWPFVQLVKAANRINWINNSVFFILFLFC